MFPIPAGAGPPPGHAVGRGGGQLIDPALDEALIADRNVSIRAARDSVQAEYLGELKDGGPVQAIRRGPDPSPVRPAARGTDGDEAQVALDDVAELVTLSEVRVGAEKPDQPVGGHPLTGDLPSAGTCLLNAVGDEAVRGDHDMLEYRALKRRRIGDGRPSAAVGGGPHLPAVGNLRLETSGTMCACHVSPTATKPGPPWVMSLIAVYVSGVPKRATATHNAVPGVGCRLDPVEVPGVDVRALDVGSAAVELVGVDDRWPAGRQQHDDGDCCHGSDAPDPPRRKHQSHGATMAQAAARGKSRSALHRRPIWTVDQISDFASSAAVSRPRPLIDPLYPR